MSIFQSLQDKETTSPKNTTSNVDLSDKPLGEASLGIPEDSTPKGFQAKSKRTRKPKNT
jgi:hypothetical protein